jgi:hypothetical protein
MSDLDGTIKRGPDHKERGYDYNRPDRNIPAPRVGKGSDHSRVGEGFRSSSYWCPGCGRGPTACKCETVTGDGTGEALPPLKECPSCGCMDVINPATMLCESCEAIPVEDRRKFEERDRATRSPRVQAARRSFLRPSSALVMVGALLAAGGTLPMIPAKDGEEDPKS